MSFEDLVVWKRACRLCVNVYRHLKECTDLGFKDQITRSALSIPCNIAEGYERNTNKDAIKFFYYAKGSAGELRTQIYIGMEIGCIHKQTGSSWLEEAQEISMMISGLIKARSA
ncbi:MULTISPECIES: four helix bundle protein [Methylotuvimicrobium]|uniref:four helix bundle protein n=1 Tax=Methylotuvimicrobium TaxID=2822410 RepID=UPI0005FB9CC0|nr:four helix bundle protein [Methylotuvimicrobium alcaliphilum]